ncbi:MAG: nucleoside deaminase [Epulopiscium sp.]|jgi:tRNA(adenine34) deaminase|nr:nucleoside deaminase [Candidatus Epulonipiscium sp.]HOQ15869.1 tRNA adenosine(34) deaminase TadA [Defluviitaleaceae bacterium]HPT76600.1 tRNA adenosine(34) deaminase TadA [Defluviitaleaceae bacterium]
MEDKAITFMKEALKLAEKAKEADEVPIGAVIVYNDEIIGRGYNQRNSQKNPLAHAEIQAIEEAAKYIGDWRLEGCSIYVTLEPCPMCAGAIVQARIDKIIFGTRNPKAGCGGSILNILNEPRFNHQVEIIEGICQEECSQILKTFFTQMRNKRLKMEVDI